VLTFRDALHIPSSTGSERAMVIVDVLGRCYPSLPRMSIRAVPFSDLQDSMSIRYSFDLARMPNVSLRPRGEHDCETRPETGRGRRIQLPVTADRTERTENVEMRRMSPKLPRNFHHTPCDRKGDTPCIKMTTQEWCFMRHT